MYNRIVTHKGQAHRDDFTACCIALYKFPTIRSIQREDPTADDLKDPECLVLDVGNQLDPENGNFDHHQFDRTAPATCALTLFLAHLQLLERFRLLDWVASTEIMDAHGPMALAKHLGLAEPSSIFKNFSPVEGALIAQFETMKRLGEGTTLWDVMKLLGGQLVDSANEIHVQMEWLTANSRVVGLQGVPALVIESPNMKGIQKFRDQFHPSLGICISLDDRGAGWSLYRFNDDSRVDFSRLENDPAVLFAHKGGFIAKTRERLGIEEVFALVAKAIL